MSKQSYKQLLEKYKNGTATEHDLKLLEEYADEMIERSETQVFFSQDDKNIIKNELKQRVKVRPPVKLSSWIRVAASIVLVAGLSLTFWFNKNQIMGPEMALVSTGIGEQKTVTLNDGSEIILNAKSSLEYPVAFAKNERTVSLNGEALFKVAKDANRPFQVVSNGITTTVLGTVFNVNSYSNDSAVTVSLLEGLVSVEGLGESMLIEPMQESRFNLKSKTVEVGAFDSLSIVAWQIGDLILSKTSFDQLQRIVNRKYGVQIEFNEPGMADYTISGKFRNPDISTLLESICAAKSLHFKEINNNQFLIY